MAKKKDKKTDIKFENVIKCGILNDAYKKVTKRRKKKDGSKRKGD